ncbi:MAG: helix-turn-helix transcriptional regulator [Acutalibacteraceae bacterium]|nr:helix-turn-helix transcriptional regulator [Acutalibacteraceae bacterium]
MKERLEQLLEARNMKPAQLAQAAGLGTSTVDDIIKGKTNELNVGVDKMLRIASLLGVSVESLYGRDEPVTPYIPPEPAERQLLDRFRSLNAEGKEKALDYLDDLVDTGKYKKRDPAGMVQEA